MSGRELFQVSSTVSVDGKAIVAKEMRETEDLATEKSVTGEAVTTELGEAACRNARTDSKESQEEHSGGKITSERNGAACKETISGSRVKRERGSRVNAQPTRLDKAACRNARTGSKESQEEHNGKKVTPERNGAAHKETTSGSRVKRERSSRINAPPLKLAETACRIARTDSKESQEEHSGEKIIPERNGAAHKETTSGSRVKRERSSRVNGRSRYPCGKADPAVSCKWDPSWEEDEGYRRGLRHHGEQHSVGPTCTPSQLDQEHGRRCDKELHCHTIINHYGAPGNSEHTRWLQGEDGTSDRGFRHRRHRNHDSCHWDYDDTRPKSSHYYQHGSRSGEDPAVHGRPYTQYYRRPHRSGDARKSRNTDHAIRDEAPVNPHSSRRRPAASSKPSRSYEGAEQSYKTPRHRQSQKSRPGRYRPEQPSARMCNGAIVESEEMSRETPVRHENRKSGDCHQSTCDTRDRESRELSETPREEATA